MVYKSNECKYLVPTYLQITDVAYHLHGDYDLASFGIIFDTEYECAP